MDYATAVAAYNDAVSALPAKPAKDASDAEWDIYCAARTAKDVAEDAMHDAYANRMRGFVGTIRKA